MRNRREFLAACGGLASGMLAFSPLARAGSGSLFDAVNGMRRGAGAPVLDRDRAATPEAGKHAERMVSAGKMLPHPDLYGIATDERWGVVSEVVGVGSSVDDIIRQAHAHPSSRANLLDRYDAMAAATRMDEHGRLFAAVFLFRTANCAR